MTELIPIVVVCGIGADLATLPLLICTALLAAGIKTPPASLAWLGSWWMIVIATMVLVVEIIFDTMMDRRNKLIKKAWPVFQLAMTAMITIMVIIALGADLSLAQKTAALGAAFITTGVIKAGLLEQFRSSFDTLLGK